ncbi:hypothetical protein PIB30_022726 [Stylosanthes scabra]|uniref:Uncharacterized protein n=1 Tax=Stylosanthes scabra TaxID=79078 RepID=A0ABU6Y9G9_9FABA|nr:hypothetical protein [Stylosanthes scabra]
MRHGRHACRTSVRVSCPKHVRHVDTPIQRPCFIAPSHARSFCFFNLAPRARTKPPRYSQLLSSLSPFLLADSASTSVLASFSIATHGSRRCPGSFNIQVFDIIVRQALYIDF